MSRSHVRPSHPRARLAAALASATFVLAPAAAAHADGWLDGPDFGVGQGNFGVGLAEAPDGSSTAVWSDGTHVMLRQASAAGAVGLAQQVGDADDNTEPVVAVGPSGAGVVVWSGPLDQDTGNFELEVRTFSAGGTLGSAEPLGSASFVDRPVAVVDAAGNATVAWSGQDTTNFDDFVQVRRVAADGSLGGPVLTGGNAVVGYDATVAVAPNGVAWVGWLNDGVDSASVVRLTPTGALDGTPATVSTQDDEAASLQLAASDAGAVATWIEVDDQSSDEASLRAVRLSNSGSPFVGAALTLPAEPAELVLDTTPPAPAIGPDGTVTVLWPGAPDGAPSNFPVTNDYVARFAGGATDATPVIVSDPNGGDVNVEQRLASAPDGTLLASWVGMPLVRLVEGPDPDSGLFAGTVTTRRIAPDGSLGSIAPAGPAPLDLCGCEASALAPVPQVDDAGSGLLGIVTAAQDGRGMVTRRLHTAGPTVTTNVPASTIGLAPITVSAAAEDPAGIRSYAWDFGDGTSSEQPTIKHAFSDLGTYTVTLTVTDNLGNVTTVTHQVAVTPPPSTGPARFVVPPAPKPIAAGLKIAKATRAGAKVTISGTISTRASGKLTIAYAQKVGRRTLKATAAASVAKGRWSVTLKLNGKLASAKGKATVSVTYRGDADTAKASAKHAVSTAKPKPKKEKAEGHAKKKAPARRN